MERLATVFGSVVNQLRRVYFRPRARVLVLLRAEPLSNFCWGALQCYLVVMALVVFLVLSAYAADQLERGVLAATDAAARIQWPIP